MLVIHLRKRFYSALMGAAVYLLCTATSFSATDAVLLGIQITEKETQIDLQVDFSVPLHYMRHFPPKAGEILQIQLGSSEAVRPEDEKAAEGGVVPTDPPAQTDSKQTAKRESMLPPASESSPLINVTYEGEVPGGPFLTLRFKFPVEYTLTEGAGGMSLIVSIKRDVGGLAVRANADGDSTALSDQKMAETMEDARQSLAREDFGRAIQLLSKMLQMATHKYTQEAKELVGVAREKKGQIARAKLEYQEYIRLYPEGEGAERVKQRLAAIELAQVAPRERLKEIKQQTTTLMDTFGRVSGRYYQDTTDIESVSSRTRATLTTFLNVSSRYRDDEYDARGFFNIHNVLGVAGDTSNEKPEINSMYVDVKNRQKKYSAVLGRQSSNKGGIFGRFEGAVVSYEFKPKYEVTASIGRPISFSSNDIDADRQFYGTSLSMAGFVTHWDANAYFIEQSVETMVDRRAVGGDVRYNDKLYSFFASGDYDISYSVLNLIFLRGGWKANEKTRIDVNYNLRQSPMVLTTTALQQEGVTTFGEPTEGKRTPTIERLTSFQQLQALVSERGMSESDIRDKVAKFSSLSRMLTIDAVYELDQNNQINADLTQSSIDGRGEVPVLIKCVPPDVSSPCDAGSNVIAANEKYGPELSYSVQLISSNYFFERDLHMIGGRYSTGENRSSTSLFVRSRFPYEEQWYISPRIQYDRTQDDTNNVKTSRPSFSVKVDYRWKKQVSFEAEVGYESNSNSGGINRGSDYTRTTFLLGYNVDF